MSRDDWQPANGWRTEGAFWRAREDGGTEFITLRGLVDVLDDLEAEVYESRRRSDAFPTPAHIGARRLLEALGRRDPW